MKKFLLSKTPYVRSVDDQSLSTTRMMNDVLIALVPIVMFGFVINGLIPYINGELNSIYFLLKPIINVLVGGISSLLFEFLYFLCFNKNKSFKELIVTTFYNFGAITGVLISLLLPVRIPLYVIVFGCLIGNIIFKMLFGGLGHNIFNPALIAYIFCYAAFSEQIGIANADQVIILSNTLNITATSTPLTDLLKQLSISNSLDLTYDMVVAQYGSFVNLFIGFNGGALGEVSGLLCIVGFIYLLCRKVINWRVPIIYVGTVFVICYAVSIFNHIEGPMFGLWFPLYNVLTGGLLFGAVFMATEPVTTPKTPNGKVIFAIALGVMTVLIRLVAGTEGVATSILFVCLFTPIIDRFASRNRGPVITPKIIFNYVILGLFYLGIVAYIIYTTLSWK